MDASSVSDYSSRIKKDKQMIKIGTDRIKNIKESDDIAVISMVPMDGDPKFRCFLGRDCLLRDWKKAEPGDKISSRN